MKNKNYEKSNNFNNLISGEVIEKSNIFNSFMFGANIVYCTKITHHHFVVSGIYTCIIMDIIYCINVYMYWRKLSFW